MRGATTYDITMGNDVARDAHCDIKMGKNVTIGTSIVMSQ